MDIKTTIILYVIGGLCMLMVILSESDKIKWFSIKSRILRLIISIIAFTLILIDTFISCIPISID